MVGVFAEVRRVLKPDGTLWLNMGDCHANADKGGYCNDRIKATDSLQAGHQGANFSGQLNRIPQLGLKPKDLVGIPWRVAFALQADEWWLRSDIIWSKPNPMPESIRDRPTRAHEYVFLMSRSERYYYDADAIAERAAEATIARISQPTFDQQTGGPKDPKDGNRSARKALANLKRKMAQAGRRYDRFHDRWDKDEAQGVAKFTRNARTVWTIATQPYPEAHFATFPEELARRCVVAGTRPDDLVLDPFAGSGTTGIVALANGRRFVGIELNEEYCRMAERRLRSQPFQMVLA